jgi:N-acetylglucosamine-6-phosphate deacetylase
MAITVLYNATVFSGIARMPESTVLMEDGKIIDVISNARFRKKTYAPGTVVIDLEGLNLAPGFIDTHIHGLHGFGTDDASTESALAMSEALTHYGVTSFCPTLYPAEKEALLTSIRACSAAQGREIGAKILGLHLEGPFISSEKLGVQRPESLHAVDISFMKDLYSAAEGSIAIMTVAPELKNMRDLALFCNRQGTVLSAGHTNAGYEHMVEGMQAGILHSTHCYNAMRPLHHRDPGTVGAILLHSNLSTEIIADGFHVHPALITLLMRSKPVDRIILVTDALKPTMQKTGIMSANGEEVYLGDDGVFHRRKDDCIAGSSLTMIKGIQNLVSYGVSLESALAMASTNPSNLLDQDHRRGYLLPNSWADIAIFDNTFTVQMTYVHGELKFNRYKYTVRDPEFPETHTCACCSHESTETGSPGNMTKEKQCV